MFLFTKPNRDDLRTVHVACADCMASGCSARSESWLGAAGWVPLGDLWRTGGTSPGSAGSADAAWGTFSAAWPTEFPGVGPFREQKLRTGRVNAQEVREGSQFGQMINELDDPWGKNELIQDEGLLLGDSYFRFVTYSHLPRISDPVQNGLDPLFVVFNGFFPLLVLFKYSFGSLLIFCRSASTKATSELFFFIDPGALYLP